MKNILITFLLSTTLISCGVANSSSESNVLSSSQSCKNRIADPNWTENKFEYVLSCKLEEVLKGEPKWLTERVCFGRFKSQYGGFKDTVHMGVRHDNDHGGIALIYIGEGKRSDGELTIKDNQITLSSISHDWTSGGKFKREMLVNTEKLEIINSNYDRQLFGWKKSFSGRYSCEVELDQS